MQRKKLQGHQYKDLSNVLSFLCVLSVLEVHLADDSLVHCGKVYPCFLTFSPALVWKERCNFVFTIALVSVSRGGFLVPCIVSECIAPVIQLQFFGAQFPFQPEN